MAGTLPPVSSADEPSYLRRTGVAGRGVAIGFFGAALALLGEEPEFDRLHGFGSSIYDDPLLAEDFQIGHNFGYGLGFWTAIFSAKAKEAPVITEPYVRPSGTPTRAQRESVQGQPCVDCGATGPVQRADHKTPLVVEYYTTGTINMERAKSLGAVQPQCVTCSARQGANLSRYSKMRRKELGLD